MSQIEEDIITVLEIPNAHGVIDFRYVPDFQTCFPLFGLHEVATLYIIIHPLESHALFVPSIRVAQVGQAIATRDRNRIELSNNSVRFGSTQPNRTEPNPNFGKVGRIESNRMQNESNRTEPNANS